MPTPEQLLNDPSASDWLKTALRSALQRDPIDARHDAYILSDVLDERALKLLDEASIQQEGEPHDS